MANDDDQNPTFNVWDLRNPQYPAKDYRTIIANSKTGERLLEFPT